MMNLSFPTLEMNFIKNRHYIHSLHSGINSMPLNFNITEQHLKSFLEINYLQSYKPKLHIIFAINTIYTFAMLYTQSLTTTYSTYHLSSI